MHVSTQYSPLEGKGGSWHLLLCALSRDSLSPGGLAIRTWVSRAPWWRSQQHSALPLCLRQGWAGRCCVGLPPGPPASFKSRVCPPPAGHQLWTTGRGAQELQGRSQDWQVPLTLLGDCRGRTPSSALTDPIPAFRAGPAPISPTPLSLYIFAKWILPFLLWMQNASPFSGSIPASASHCV